MDQQTMDFSPSRDGDGMMEHHRPRTSQACHSIEEASIDTTIESATTQEIQQSTLDNECSRVPSRHGRHHVTLRLTPEEERLFELLIEAAEQHERGTLSIDPNPPQQSISARGGFTKGADRNADRNADRDTNKGANKDAPQNCSWLSPPPKVDRIEIRIAGGWVRDKILNQHSSDVDVALDCMMGVQFARIVQSHLAHDSTHRSAHGSAHGSAPGNGKKPKIGVIGANPSQSKHLETATMTIHGIDVDFVNLRAEEVYDADSRIPRTRHFGTPLEDALRRDFTINSLFYNVRSRRIEDWTGRGLRDLLTTRQIVTPVSAHETFHDDPLRVLRAIRFGVRLGFQLQEELRSAAMSSRVHHSLHVKVSRERVGKELEGMLTGKGARPGKALDLIAQLHLAGSVFCFPGSFPGDLTGTGSVHGHILGVPYHCPLGKDCGEAAEIAAQHRRRGWEESTELLALLPSIMEIHVDERDKLVAEIAASTGVENTARISPTAADFRLLHLCVFILPFHNLTFPDAKGCDTLVTTHMIKEGLKFPNRDITAVSKILQHVDEMSQLLSELRIKMIQSHEEGINDLSPCRLRSGLLLRSLKEHWATCLLTAAAWEIRSQQQTDRIDNSAPIETPSREMYRAIVRQLNLDQCWRIRPLLDGKSLISELSLPKGPLVGVYLDDQVRWMLLHPEGTKEQCIAHLQERKRERERSQELRRNDQNEIIMGVANGDGHSSTVLENSETKHFSKKIRAEHI